MSFASAGVRAGMSTALPAPLPATPIVYCHGMPGGPGEWVVNAPAALREAAFLPDRNAPALVDPQTLADAISARFPQGGITLVGFSLGAFAALRVAARLGRQVAALHLISPAGPLQLGDFLPRMAGGPLFRMAGAQPRLFGAVAHVEAWLARGAPGFLLGRLMASAAGQDIALRSDPAFRAGMAGVLRAGLGRDPRGFIAEVRAYVDDWRGELAKVTAPVTLWQGDADNWTPTAMATALAAALPGRARVEWLPGCSHYSALRAALIQIAAP